MQVGLNYNQANFKKTNISFSGFKDLSSTNYTNNSFKNPKTIANHINVELTEEDLQTFKELTDQTSRDYPNSVTVGVSTQYTALKDSFVILNFKPHTIEDFVATKNTKRISLVQKFLARIADPNTNLGIKLVEDADERFGNPMFVNRFNKQVIETTDYYPREQQVKELATKMLHSLTQKVNEAFIKGY